MDIKRIVIYPNMRFRVMLFLRCERTIHDLNPFKRYRAVRRTTRDNLHFMAALPSRVDERGPQLRIGREGVVEV